MALWYALADLFSGFGEYHARYQLSAEEGERYRKESVAIFEDLIANHADVAKGSYAKSAKGALFEIRHLQVGMTVPEVSGEDIDGKTMKLSEYRGKVVVIDFWGDW